MQFYGGQLASVYWLATDWELGARLPARQDFQTDSEGPPILLFKGNRVSILEGKAAAAWS
jgi:hypothetical protein